jgi:hypothetical protein
MASFYNPYNQKPPIVLPPASSGVANPYKKKRIRSTDSQPPCATETQHTMLHQHQLIPPPSLSTTTNAYKHQQSRIVPPPLSHPTTNDPSQHRSTHQHNHLLPPPSSTGLSSLHSNPSKPLPLRPLRLQNVDSVTNKARRPIDHRLKSTWITPSKKCAVTDCADERMHWGCNQENALDT